MKIYLYQTLTDENGKQRLRPLPYQTFEDGRPIIPSLNVQADATMRRSYPLGTIFASNLIEERSSTAQAFYAAGDIFPVSVQRNELKEAGHEPTPEMKAAYTEYVGAHAEEMSGNASAGSGVLKEQKGRPLSLLSKMKKNPRFAIPTIKTDGFWVDEDTWWDLMVDLYQNENILFKGPAGSGKTELLMLAARKLGLDCHVYDMGSMYDPISDLLGVHRMTAQGSVFDYAQFTQDIQKEGIILLDELSRATPAVNNILMPCLDSRRTLRVEMAGGKDVRSIPVHPKCRFAATANLGAGYVGANELDVALRDRFEEFDMTYMPQAEEIELLATKYKIPRADATNIVKAANNVRDVAAKGDLELSVTTRETIRAAKKVAAGYTAQKAMERTFLPRFEGTLSEGSRSVVWQIIISN